MSVTTVVTTKEEALAAKATTDVAPETESQAAPQEPVVDEPQAPPTEEATSDAVTEPVDHNAILQPFFEEFQMSGSLSDDSMSRCAEALGTTKELIGLVVDGMQARQQARVAAVFTPAGGEAAYREMIQWATEKFSPDEAQAFNQILDTGSVEEITTAVSNLKKQFTEVKGSPQVDQQKVIPPTPTAGSSNVKPSSSSGVSDGFKSFSELMAAQKDPRYGKDDVYTKEVYRKALNLMG